jgi:hypothetical protein
LPNRIPRELVREREGRKEERGCKRTPSNPHLRKFACRSVRTLQLTNSMALVRERTIPTERPQLVGEVSANFCGLRGVAWSVRRIPYGSNLDFLDRRTLQLTQFIHVTCCGMPCLRTNVFKGQIELRQRQLLYFIIYMLLENVLMHLSACLIKEWHKTSNTI